MKLNHRRWLVPEVVQTSATDCGPAALKCLLEGFGIPVSYGRLREACQTDVDGTSIDTMEEIAVQLGLEAEQIMVPPDYLLLEETKALPAIAVVELPTGMTHFILVWRKHGPLVQTMDPAAGRRWLTRERLLSSLHVHTQLAPLHVWREWATSEKFLKPLHRKLSDLGCSNSQASRLTERAAAANGWRPLATLEASVRTVEALVLSRSLSRGSEASNLVNRLFEDSQATDRAKSAIPLHFWSVEEAPLAEDGTEQIYFRGAVLVHATRRREEAQPKVTTVPAQEESSAAVSPEIAAALQQPQTEPYVELFRLLKADGADSRVHDDRASSGQHRSHDRGITFSWPPRLCSQARGTGAAYGDARRCSSIRCGNAHGGVPNGLRATEDRTKAGGTLADRLPREDSTTWGPLLSQPA